MGVIKLDSNSTDLLSYYRQEKSPTTSSNVSRHQIAQPRTRPTEITSDKSTVIETSYGRSKITGRIGQRHLDIMELIFATCDDSRVMDNNSVEFLVDVYKIRALAGKVKAVKQVEPVEQNLIDVNPPPTKLPCKQKRIKKERVVLMHPSTFATLVRDLSEAHVEIYSNNGAIDALGGILFIERLKKEVPTRPGCFKSLSGKNARKLKGANLEKTEELSCSDSGEKFNTFDERNYYKVTITPVFMKFMGEGVALYYDPLPIVRLENGISKAIARFVLSHDVKKTSTNGWKLRTAFESVNVRFTGDRTIDNKIMYVNTQELMEDRSRLEGLGIFIEFDGKAKKLYRAEPKKAEVI